MGWSLSDSKELSNETAIKEYVLKIPICELLKESHRRVKLDQKIERNPPPPQKKIMMPVIHRVSISTLKPIKIETYAA